MDLVCINPIQRLSFGRYHPPGISSHSLGRDTETTNEHLPHMPTVPEPCLLRHHIQAVAALLDHQAGSLKTQALHSLCG